MDVANYLVPSEDLNIGVSGKCYVGLFTTANAKCAPCVYLGMIFMKTYYTFLDLSGLQAGTASLPILGFGLKVPNANIL